MDARHINDPTWRKRALHAITELAGRQHGVVAREQLIRLGIPARTIDRWLAASRLHRVYSGVYAVGHRRLSPLGRCTAAGLAAGAGGGLSHRGAVWLWGLPQGLPDILDVSNPRRHRHQRGLRCHRVLLPPDELTEEEGIPVTIPSRSILDVAPTTESHRLERMIEVAERRELHAPVSYTELLRRYPRRPGTAKLAAILGLHREPDWRRSEWEALTRSFCDRHGIRVPRLNYLFHHGDRTYELDGFWPELMLALEFDSWEFHGGRRSFREDRIRDRQLTRAGVRTVRITAYDLGAGEAALAADLAALTAERAPD